MEPAAAFETFIKRILIMCSSLFSERVALHTKRFYTMSLESRYRVIRSKQALILGYM